MVGQRKEENLVLVGNVALQLLIVAFVAAALFDHLIDREMFQICALREELAVTGFAWTEQ